MIRWVSLFLSCFAILCLVSCTKESNEIVELKRFPMDGLDGLITRSGIAVDKEVTSDGGGSLRVEATDPTVVRLFEITDINVDNARLLYQASLRSNGLDGKAYLEMWCRLPGKGQFFSRGLETPIMGTTEWISEEIPFVLEKGEKPDRVKLNLVIDGKGIVWIDDVRLLKEPLR